MYYQRNKCIIKNELLRFTRNVETLNIPKNDIP
jgi:hypothetical protein